MQVNLPVYKNSSYAVNPQRQNPKLTFTSRSSSVSDAAAKSTNYVLDKLRNIMSSPIMQARIDRLKKAVISKETKQVNITIINNNYISIRKNIPVTPVEDSKFMQQSVIKILGQIKEELASYLEKPKYEKAKVGVSEWFKTKDIDIIKKNVNELLQQYNGRLPVKTPYTVAFYSINKNVNELGNKILSDIDETIKLTDKTGLNKIVADLETLQILLGGRVKTTKYTPFEAVLEEFLENLTKVR